MKRLPTALAGPVTVALAKPAEAIPAEPAMLGGSVYELKWDGYRLVIVHTEQGVRLWSRNGTDLTARFHDIATAAAAQIPAGAVVDGEVVIWHQDHLSFDHLQARLVSGVSRVVGLARHHPASYVAFDLLAREGTDLRRSPWTRRRDELEALAVSWRPPMQLSPYTESKAEAVAWFSDYRRAGIEGLVTKGASSTYAPGRRAWIKVKNRETRDVIVGAVIPSLAMPQVVVAGLHDTGGELVIVGRTVPLTAVQARALSEVLHPPVGPHPWPQVIGSGRFGGAGSQVPITHVDPVVIAEVTADTALQSGKYRHPLRYVRHRPDLEPGDVAPVQRTVGQRRRR